MKFEEFSVTIPTTLSAVKRKILKTLWEAGTSFPREWVKSSTLLRVTKQKYFDRRIRELRDEGGIDIEAQYFEEEHCYRLNSTNLTKGHRRFYLSEANKQKLFEKNQYHCAVCGKKHTPGVRGLQADHKIPLIRGGRTDVTNWQALCNECNVKKRSACRDCEDDCRECSWAFPERGGTQILVRLEPDIEQMLKYQRIDTAPRIESLVREAIREYLKKKKGLT